MDHINVIIAENELGEREKLKSQLAGESDIQVVGEARDGKECLDLVTRHRPDVVLIKEDLPVRQRAGCRRTDQRRNARGGRYPHSDRFGRPGSLA